MGVNLSHFEPHRLTVDTPLLKLDFLSIYQVQRTLTNLNRHVSGVSNRTHDVDVLDTTLDNYLARLFWFDGWVKLTQRHVKTLAFSQSDVCHGQCAFETLDRDIAVV